MLPRKSRSLTSLFKRILPVNTERRCRHSPLLPEKEPVLASKYCSDVVVNFGSVYLSRGLCLAPDSPNFLALDEVETQIYFHSDFGCSICVQSGKGPSLAMRLAIAMEIDAGRTSAHILMLFLSSRWNTESDLPSMSVKNLIKTKYNVPGSYVCRSPTRKYLRMAGVEET